MRVLALSGSLQTASSNQALLRAARGVAPVGMTVLDAPSTGSLPHFVPGLDGGEPVQAWRRAVACADAVLIASPEYAHSLPGSLKNALDWLVGSGELDGKPVAVLCATPRHGGGALGRAALEQTLRAQGAQVRVTASVLVRPGAGDDLDDPALAAVGAALRALAH